MARYEFDITLIGEGDTEDEAWQDAYSSFGEDPGAPSAPGHELDEFDNRKVPGRQLFTVMLLYPDYIAETFGQETYTDCVEAEDVTRAVRAVQDELIETHANEYPDADPEDFYPLAVMLGKVEFVL
jgi:hypothetical protein